MMNAVKSAYRNSKARVADNLAKEQFNLKEGLRQGSLSSLLFIVLMDKVI